MTRPTPRSQRAVRRAAVASAGALAALLACAGLARLPEGDAGLETLAARAPAGEPLSEEFVVAQRFELEGPFPERAGAEPAQPTGPFAELLGAEVARSGGALIATEPMECVAREVARFFLAHGGLPDEPVQRFVAGRCGSVEVALRFGWLSGEMPAGQGEAALVAALRSQAETLLRSAPAGPRASAGLAFARRGQRVALVYAIGQRDVRLDAITPAEVTLDVSGALEVDAQELVAYIGTEELGAAPCYHPREPSLPRFQVACSAPFSAGVTWLTILAKRQDQILANGVLTLMVRSSDEDARVFERPFRGRSAAAATGEDPAVLFTTLVNELRADVGLPSLVLAQEESDLARRLAPHYFLAMAGQAAPGVASAEATLDIVAAGLLRGGRVSGLVEHGSFGAFAARGTDDLSRLLGEALVLPTGRNLLLDPWADQIAVGVTRAGKPTSRGLIALLATYGTAAGAPSAALSPTDR